MQAKAQAARIDTRSRIFRPGNGSPVATNAVLVVVLVHLVVIRGVATGVDIGIYTPKISPSKLL